MFNAAQKVKHLWRQLPFMNGLVQLRYAGDCRRFDADDHHPVFAMEIPRDGSLGGSDVITDLEFLVTERQIEGEFSVMAKRVVKDGRGFLTAQCHGRA